MTGAGGLFNVLSAWRRHWRYRTVVRCVRGDVMCALQLIPKPGRKSISLRGTGASNALLLLIDRSTVSTDRSGTTFQARARDTPLKRALKARFRTLCQALVGMCQALVCTCPESERGTFPITTGRTSGTGPFTSVPSGHLTESAPHALTNLRRSQSSRVCRCPTHRLPIPIVSLKCVCVCVRRIGGELRRAATS